MIPGLLILAVVIAACVEAYRQWGGAGAVATASGFVIALLIVNGAG